MYGSKVFYLLCLVVMSLEAFTYAESLKPRGAQKELSGERRKEALDLLEESLVKLSTGDGPNYRIVKTNSVKGQTVAGTLYTFELELANGEEASKECTVKIGSKPWLTENGTNINIKCNGDINELNQTW